MTHQFNNMKQLTDFYQWADSHKVLVIITMLIIYLWLAAYIFSKMKGTPVWEGIKIAHANDGDGDIVTSMMLSGLIVILLMTISLILRPLPF